MGGGRRVALAERFKEAGCEVCGYELSVDVPLASVARDMCPGEKWDSPWLYNSLWSACEGFRADIVLPLDDAAVVALAGMGSLPAGKVCGPIDAVRACWDKGLFEESVVGRFGRDRTLYPFSRPGLPAVLKPRRGFGSRGIQYVDNFDSEDFYLCGDSDARVAQFRLTGQEYSVDAYFNRDGKMVGASPRKRLRVAGGEVIESVTIAHPLLGDRVRSLGEALGLRGPACFQFMDGEDGIPRVIECNARFGGGSTLGCRAGLDMVYYVLREYVDGKTVPPNSVTARPGVLLSRSYRDHFFESQMLEVQGQAAVAESRAA